MCRRRRPAEFSFPGSTPRCALHQHHCHRLTESSNGKMIEPLCLACSDNLEFPSAPISYDGESSIAICSDCCSPGHSCEGEFTSGLHDESEPAHQHHFHRRQLVHLGQLTHPTYYYSSPGPIPRFLMRFLPALDAALATSVVGHSGSRALEYSYIHG